LKKKKKKRKKEEKRNRLGDPGRNSKHVLISRPAYQAFFSIKDPFVAFETVQLFSIYLKKILQDEWLPPDYAKVASRHLLGGMCSHFDPSFLPAKPVHAASRDPSERERERERRLPRVEKDGESDRP
jgi:hypothetical protein